MRTIIVKFEFPDEALEGYEDVCDELLIEDHLRGCIFDNVWYEILTQEAGDENDKSTNDNAENMRD